MLTVCGGCVIGIEREQFEMNDDVEKVARWFAARIWKYENQNVAFVVRIKSVN